MGLDIEVKLDSPDEDTECIYSGENISPHEKAICIQSFGNIYVSKQNYDDFVKCLREISVGDYDNLGKHISILDALNYEKIVLGELPATHYKFAFRKNELGKLLHKLEAVNVS